MFWLAGAFKSWGGGFQVALRELLVKVPDDWEGKTGSSFIH